MISENVIAFKAEAYPIEFVQTRSFERDSRRIFTDEELTGFLNFIAARPDAGDKIPGSPSLRKIRWRALGQGKSGGARIIYYFHDLNMPLLLLAVYAKGQVARLSKVEMKAIERKMQIILLRLLEDRRAKTGTIHSGRA